jgi:hypothetical protein
MLVMAKKKLKPPPEQTRNGVAVNVWIDPSLYAAFEAYLESKRPRPTKTSVVEVALDDFLRKEGFPPRSVSN